MNVSRNILEYWKGSKAYLLLKRRNEAGLPCFVDKDTANNRAKICTECPFNQPPGKLEKLADSIILGQTGNRTTDYDNQLQNCDACSCPLKLTVHLHGDFLKQTKKIDDLLHRIGKRQRATGKKIHPKCWQIKIFKIIA